MGRDKASLTWAGESLAVRAASLLAAVCEPVALVGAWVGPPVAGARVLPDRRPGEGPLAGLETALEAASGAAVLLLACDLPAVDASLLARLARCGPRFGAAGPEARVAAAGGRLQPLCALYSGSCAPIVRDALDRGERAVHRMLRAVRVTPVEAGDRLVNVNTPEDWERWTGGRRPVGEPR